jgi:hypothetical protein
VHHIAAAAPAPHQPARRGRREGGGPIQPCSKPLLELPGGL